MKKISEQEVREYLKKHGGWELISEYIKYTKDNIVLFYHKIRRERRRFQCYTESVIKLRNLQIIIGRKQDGKEQIDW